jgi:propionyl-CoA carboxylase beta chain
MFVTGPEVIKTVTHEDVTKEELGGATTHNTKSGVAHFVADDDEVAMVMIRELLSFLPSNNMDDPPVKPSLDSIHRTDSKLRAIVPEDPNKPYDIRDIIETVMDDNHFFEVQPFYAENIVIGFARLGGRPVGVVANQPAVLAGALDINASVKGGRFVRFCDAFNIPIVTLVDVPGFMPGTEQEFGGVIRHGAKLLYAYAEATVPKITLIVRKAYGGAYDVMSSKHLGGDINYAWPTAEIAVMGPDGAVSILHKNRLDDQERAAAVDDYREKFANPYKAAALGYIDEVIFPENTRYKLYQALEMSQNKNVSSPAKKHGNIPL